MRAEIGLVVLVSVFFIGSALAASDECADLARKVCKSARTGVCEPVYVAAETSSAICKRLSWRKIETVCGTADAKLFDSDAECTSPRLGSAVVEQPRAPAMAQPRVPAIEPVPAQTAPAVRCPASFSSLRQGDVPNIAGCLPIQKEVCRNVCGVRYDTLDVRNFGQTRGQPGLLCQDTSLEPMKNGASFASDPKRASCLEVHQGMFKWCTNYNATVNGVGFGAFVQCQGLIK